MRFFRKTGEMLKELRPHVLWDAIREGAKQTIVHASAICSLIITTFQWLQHHFGWLFFLGICASAISFGGLGIGIGRRLKRKHASEVATMARAGATDQVPQPIPSGTAPSNQLIQLATLDQIKEYDPKYRKIIVATGTALSVFICVIGAGLISVFFAGHTSQKRDFDGTAASQTEAAPTPVPTPPSERNTEVITGHDSERERVKKLDAQLGRDMQPVLADLTSRTYYCSPAEVPADKFPDTVLLSQSEAIAHRYQPYGRKPCSTADAPLDQLRRMKPGSSGGGTSITAQINQHFADLKQDKARIERAAQSPNVSRQQKEHVQQAVVAIEKVISAAETALKDPLLKTNPERQAAVLAQAQLAIAYSNAIASSTESELGISRSDPSDQVAAAKVRIEGMLNPKNLEDFTIKVSNGFDLAERNSDDVGTPYVSVGTIFYGLGNNGFTAVSVNVTYTPITPQFAEQQNRRYGGVLGGIMLADDADGLESHFHLRRPKIASALECSCYNPPNRR